MLYLDNAATTKPDPEVIGAMAPFLSEQWQNPSSGYRASKFVKSAVDEARAQVAALIGAQSDEIYFTSGGTESNNTALYSAAQLLPSDSRFVSSVIEHSAILRPLEFLESQGREVAYLSVDQGSRVSLEQLESTQTGFLSLMWANNETGVIQPLPEIVTWAREHRIPVHSDAVQAVGKIPLDVRETPVDLLSISGHKFHGVKGVGALYAREGLRLNPLLRGGGQELGIRSGTENVAGIIAMGKAAELAQQRLMKGGDSTVRDRFEQLIVERISGATINGDVRHRLPLHSHISFDDCEAAGLVILLDEYGVQCSAGSACMTGKQEASHVQRAMGFSEKRANSSLRFSFSHDQVLADAETAVAAVELAVDKLRSVQSTGVGSVVVYTPE